MSTSNPPATPPTRAEVVQNTITKKQKEIKNTPGFSLLVDGENTELGMVMRPVKTVIVKTDFKNLGNFGNVEQAANALGLKFNAEEQIQNATEQLQAKIVANNEVVQNYADTEKGPYIRMPLPEKLKDTLKVNYSSADMGQTLVGLSFGQDFITNLGKNNEAIKQSAIGAASYTIRTIISTLSSGVAAVAQKTAGNIVNPFTTALFEKVSPRSFQFSWTIQPKDVDESVRLKEVINLLRYYSLPNPSGDRLTLAVPYEWILSFVGTSFLYSFSRCVMTDLDIDYSPNGMNVFMIDTFAPQAVTITVGFQEIYPLDKQVVAPLDGKVNSMTPLTTINPEQNTPANAAAPAAASAAAATATNAANKSAQVKAAEEAVKAAEAKLQRAKATGGKIAAAQDELKSAKANLAAAKAAPGG